MPKITTVVGSKPKCVFCKTAEQDDINLGTVMSTKTISAHYYCVLLSTSIKQSGRDNEGILGFLTRDIITEVNNCCKRQCHYCRQWGATINCTQKGCSRSFHLPCGMKRNTSHEFFGQYNSFCHDHRKKSNVPTRLNNILHSISCIICLENLSSEDMEKVFWAECCKRDVVVHRHCVKKLALNAGYFTKCPACNNKDVFVCALRRCGVFVPDRDASWESNGAFDDLLYSHEQCDVINCFCPNGRKYDGRDWNLVVCIMCGSFGTHLECSFLNEKERNFICSDCDLEQSQSSSNKESPIKELQTTSLSLNNDDDSSVEFINEKIIELKEITKEVRGRIFTGLKGLPSTDSNNSNDQDDFKISERIDTQTYSSSIDLQSNYHIDNPIMAAIPCTVKAVAKKSTTLNCVARKSTTKTSTSYNRFKPYQISDIPIHRQGEQIGTMVVPTNIRLNASGLEYIKTLAGNISISNSTTTNRLNIGKDVRIVKFKVKKEIEASTDVLGSLQKSQIHPMDTGGTSLVNQNGKSAMNCHEDLTSVCVISDDEENNFLDKSCEVGTTMNSVPKSKSPSDLQIIDIRSITDTEEVLNFFPDSNNESGCNL